MTRALKTDPFRITESAWQTQVCRMARQQGFAIYHTRYALGSEPGFPDLVLIRPPRVVFTELKTDHGRLTDKQRFWADLLLACPSVEYYLWRPFMVEYVARVIFALGRPLLPWTFDLEPLEKGAR